MDRDKAKRNFLVIINGGKLRCKNPSDFIRGFEAEASEIRARFLVTEEGRLYAGLKQDTMNAQRQRQGKRKAAADVYPYNICRREGY